MTTDTETSFTVAVTSSIKLDRDDRTARRVCADAARWSAHDAVETDDRGHDTLPKGRSALRSLGEGEEVALINVRRAADWCDFAAEFLRTAPSPIPAEPDKYLIEAVPELERAGLLCRTILASVHEGAVTCSADLGQ